MGKIRLNRIVIVYDCWLAYPVTFKLLDTNTIHGRNIFNIIIFSKPKDRLLLTDDNDNITNMRLMRRKLQMAYLIQRDGVFRFGVRFMVSSFIQLCKSIGDQSLIPKDNVYRKNVMSIQHQPLTPEEIALFRRW